LPKLSRVWIGLFIIVIAGGHELYQFATGGLVFEYGDFALDAAGGVLGLTVISFRIPGRAPLP
jgi:hypothetical protein